MLPSVPVLRDGQERTSRDTRVLHDVHGEPLAEIHEAPALVTRTTVRAMRRAATVPQDDRLAALAEAGRLFAKGTPGGQSPEEYCHMQALASGVPVSVARATLNRVADDCARLGEIIARQTPAGATTEDSTPLGWTVARHIPAGAATDHASPGWTVARHTPAGAATNNALPGEASTRRAPGGAATEDSGPLGRNVARHIPTGATTDDYAPLGWTVARQTPTGAAIDDSALPGETATHQPPAAPARTARWVRRGRVFGVVAPSNHPATHGAWLQAVAMGYRVAVRPGARDPFTPLRLVRSLLEAGLAPDSIALLPGSHAAADALVDAADLALVYGGEDTVARMRGNDRVLVRGPGRSKVLVDRPLDDATLDHLVTEIASDGGVRCTNTTAVLTSGDPRELAEALAERLARLPVHPVTDERAVLPVRPLREAEGLRALLANSLDGALDVTARHYSDGPLGVLGEGEGAAALRPAVLCADRSDHPGLRLELPFPCVWVAPWRRAEGIGPLDDSLALTLLTEDSALVEEALDSPGVRTVLHGRVPGWWRDPFLPHDGYLGQFLQEARGYAAP
ncbi:aldehyde dehydrogenase family protein [Streptomyces sp. NPDC050803]|uniref:aldehyde dehydrogenase family protein n=1 Tax=unclassified Streptomyces TaxID=2593676 RepID=UPI0034252FF1